MSEEKKQLSKESYDARVADLQLKKLELDNRQLERSVQTGDMAEQNISAKAKRNGQTLTANLAHGLAKAAGCNHKKGGKGLEGFKGAGNDSDYAVIKHQFPHGEIGVICQRCPKIWMAPILPVEADFESKQAFNLAQKQYAKDLAEYRWALALPTDNEMSTSGLFTGPGFQDECRKVMRDSTEFVQAE